jgi:undecaprenyl-diphosphatase|tara:strand:+ start:85 stop:771 length:687 start_codon:yes stop_codon:yes gene_type:complete
MALDIIYFTPTIMTEDLHPSTPSDLLLSKKLTLVSLTLALTLGLFASLKSNPIQPLDNFLRDIFYSHNSTDFAWFSRWVLASFGHWQTGLLGLIIGIAILLKQKRFRSTIGFVYGLAMTLVASSVLKDFVGRDRPQMAGDMINLAWPSGHTMLATVLWGSLLLIVFKEQVNQKLAMKIWLIIVTITASGRMLAGVHWFTDVVGGFLIGVLILQSTLYFEEKSPTPLLD